MTFFSNSFDVFMIYNDNNIRIYNDSKYKCRVHFTVDNSRYSLLCYGQSVRVYDESYNQINMKTQVQKNVRTLLKQEDLQFYFENEQLYRKYQQWKYDREKKLLEDNGNSSKSSDESSLEKFRKGEIDWASDEPIIKNKHKNKNSNKIIEEKNKGETQSNKQNIQSRGWEKEEIIKNKEEIQNNKLNTQSKGWEKEEKKEAKK